MSELKWGEVVRSGVEWAGTMVLMRWKGGGVVWDRAWAAEYSPG